MSGEWQQLANQATSAPPRKTGVATVMSLTCPAVIHGSLVMSTSPSASAPGGYFATMWPIPVAMALMWPGVPPED